MSKRNENASKLNKSRRHTIDEFLSKLERDHFEMELSYGKLFAELGYAFVSEPIDDEVFEKEDSDYNEFNQRLSSTLDEVSPVIKSNESANQSQMDKIKHTLDDLKARINVMRKKFRQYTINLKPIGTTWRRVMRVRRTRATMKAITKITSNCAFT